MAKPAKYPYKLTLRLSDEGGQYLEKQAKIMDVPPAVAGRLLIEHPLKISKSDGNGPLEPSEPRQ